MASDTVQSSRDWLRNPRTNLLAWWMPQAAILAGLFVPVPLRSVIWIIALIWMGTACILNARRCGRIHCRYTGPYYLAMIAPVLLLACLILFRQLAQGFRSADLRAHLAALSGCDPASISQGAITYQLRRLRLHGLIERVPTSFRYRVTDFGFRVALFFTRTYNRLLRPGLAAALPALRAISTPLKRAFEAIAAQIDTIINEAQLAAKKLTHLRQVSFVKQG